MRRRAAVSIHARLERVRAVRRGIAQHRKRRGSLHTPSTLDRGKKTPGGAGTCRDTHKGKKTPGGAGIASSLSDANPVPCLSDGQGVKKPCKTPLYFSPRPRARSPMRSPSPSTAPCERLVSTHARRPPMAPPGMASRGPPPGPSLLTIARLSQRPSFSRTRLDYIDSTTYLSPHPP